ncbi:MAG: dipeptidase [Planctomycetota bacterium]
MINYLMRIATLLLLLASPAGVCLAGETPEMLAERAMRAHAEAWVIDSHSDTALRMLDPGWDFMMRHDDGHMDYPRIREGGLDAVFLAIYMGQQKPEEPGISVEKAVLQFDRILCLVEQNPDRLGLARTAADIRDLAGQGKTAVLIGIEGGHIIDNKLEALRCYHRLGARYMTLTHSFHHDWADSSGIGEPIPEGHGGLTDFGRQVILEMNRIGMMVDISHVSDETFWDVIEQSKAPIIATHSGARAICDHPRNLSDEMIRTLAERGGVVQVVFFPGFLDPDYKKKAEAAKNKCTAREEEIRKTYSDDPLKQKQALRELWREFPVEATPFSVLIDHIEHILQLAGPDHVGLGADWDGVWTMVEGLDDCSKIPLITLELLKRGHSEATVKKILGGNLLRVMEEVDKTAATM